jgi:hypothetical protein
VQDTLPLGTIYCTKLRCNPLFTISSACADEVLPVSSCEHLLLCTWLRTTCIRMLCCLVNNNMLLLCVCLHMHGMGRRPLRCYKSLSCAAMPVFAVSLLCCCCADVLHRRHPL